jgi:DNA-binding LacI/PurR family transcriptional regulator
MQPGADGYVVRSVYQRTGNMTLPSNLGQVAKLAGVSRSAVSRSFTAGASVSPKTKAKVLKAAKQLGYSPNLLARSLITRRTGLIGLVSDNFHNPAFLEVFDLFTRRLQERGYRPLISNITKEYTPEKLVEMMRQYRVDAVILASSALSSEYALRLHERNIPVVHAFGRNSGGTWVNTVGVDNRLCGRIAAEHFVALGYDDVAFLGGPQLASTTVDRWDGFRETLAQYSQVKVSVSYAGEYSFQAGRSAMRLSLEGKPAQAYFCGDDVLSLGAMSAMRDAGLSIPRDVGVLGVNDIEMAGWSGIDLSTIRQPIPDIISGAVNLVLTAFETENHSPEQRLYPCRLVERKTLPLRVEASTGAARTSK